MHKIVDLLLSTIKLARSSKANTKTCTGPVHCASPILGQMDPRTSGSRTFVRVQFVLGSICLGPIGPQTATPYSHFVQVLWTTKRSLVISQKQLVNTSGRRYMNNAANMRRL